METIEKSFVKSGISHRKVQGCGEFEIEEVGIVS